MNRVEQPTLMAGFDIGPIRRSHLSHLMEWRNDQRQVLRQQHLLTMAGQHQWYEERVLADQQSDTPSEILVVIEEDRVPISYGGLTNIDWVSARAELSFLTATGRSAQPDVYDRDFDRFLEWIKPFAFSDIGLRRVFTETFAFRRRHIERLEAHGWQMEGRMREHVVMSLTDPEPVDSVIHGLLAHEWEQST